MSSSTWRPDVPVELPNGTLVCSSHGFVVCHQCICDYSFMSEGESDYEPMPTRKPAPSAPIPDTVSSATAAKDPITITRFTPPTATVQPLTLFPGTVINLDPYIAQHNMRYIRATNPKELLIFTDGACLNNGLPNSRAGCAFVFKPATAESSGITSFRLENRGPTGELHPQTSNRAELRAVIGALEYRPWCGEGFHSLVIAMDSEYVVEGATRWVNKWRRNGWKTAAGGVVKNRDLWERLLGEVGKLSDQGLEVKFWRIGRDWNKVADGEAKMVAENKDVEHYRLLIRLRAQG